MKKEPERDKTKPDEASAAYPDILKRNEHFTTNASMISKECKDLFCESLRRRYRIHREFLEATTLEDLLEMQDDHIWSNPRLLCDYEYFCIYIRTRSARDPFFLIERALQEKYRQVCVWLG